ncbi:MAG: DUF4238 domain-containing protein [Lactococcus hircilactis]
MNWKEKNQYVKRQHYVPQFSIRPFEVEKGKCLVVDLKNLEVSKQDTQNILQEIDLYEVKNEFGEYINRNEIEDTYKIFEDYVDKRLKRFVEIMIKDDFQETYSSMVRGLKNTQWATMEAGLLFHIIVTLIRSPRGKEIIDKSDFPKFMKPVIYRQMTSGNLMAVELAKNLLNGQELEVTLQLLKENPKTALEPLTKHIMENYGLRIFRVSGEENLFLSDEPILIQKFSEADYVLPISPKLCVGTTKLKWNGDKIQLDSKVYTLTDDEVREINYSSVQNATNLVIVQSEADLLKVKKLMVN